MRRVVLGGLIVLGTIAVALIVVGLVIGVGRWAVRGRVPSKTLLEADFEKGLVEYVPDDPIAKAMLGRTPIVRDVVEALERASGDDRVVGLIARIGGGGMGIAQAQELRDAVIAFRAKGKRAVAFSESFGEFGPGNIGYYLATAFDEIDLQPSGDIGLTGIMLASPFVRGTLDKLGVEPRMDHRHEYKNAMNIFTEKKFTDAHRESMAKIMNSWFDQIVRGIAQGRKIPETDVRSLFDRGPYLGRQAVEARLVDAVSYRDEVYAKLRERAGKDAQLLYLDKYLERAGRPHEKGKAIALIYGVGGVERGESGYNPVFGAPAMGSDTVGAAFRSAIEDKDVKAIVFRVDSPGGSYVASDAIWRETIRAKQAGKPVIVSMGDLAGSGGYFVAMAADKIVAQPGTITASIGVFGGKMLTSGLWDKLGITFDEIHTGSASTMFSELEDYSPQQWAKFEAWLDRVYEDFTSKVAKGRRLPKEQVLRIARGRIWSGEDAKALGLVDELGGFPVALRLAKGAAGLAADSDFRLKVFPRERSTLDMLLAQGAENSERTAIASFLAWTVRQIGPLKGVAQALGFAPAPGVLAMRELEPVR